MLLPITLIRDLKKGGMKMQVKEFDGEWWIKLEDALKTNKTLKKMVELHRDMAEKLLKGADELLLDVVYQACGDADMIDNQCISAYEEACQYLESRGYLKKENDRSYQILRKVE